MRNQRLILFGVCALLVVVLVGLNAAFPDAPIRMFHFVSERGVREVQSKLDRLLSTDTLIFLAILSTSFMIDLLALGYGKSALRNVLNPDKSTWSDIVIFLLEVFGLWRFVIAFSFLLIGYFIGAWARTNIAFNWLHRLELPALQLLVYLVVLDFLDYWMHRTSHRVSWWWEVHKLHHSATNFNLVTTGRHHPLDLALGQLYVTVPMAMLGMPLQDYFFVYVCKSILGYLQHSMVPWRFGLLGRYVVMSPVDHRIHHSPHPVHWDKHFGHFLVIWDRLFGTYYDGSFVNERIGLSDTDDNERGVTCDIIKGQLRFLKALFWGKWSFHEGVLTPEEIKQIEAANQSLQEPAV